MMKEDDATWWKNNTESVERFSKFEGERTCEETLEGYRAALRRAAGLY